MSLKVFDGVRVHYNGIKLNLNFTTEIIKDSTLRITNGELGVDINDLKGHLIKLNYKCPIKTDFNNFYDIKNMKFQ